MEDLIQQLNSSKYQKKAEILDQFYFEESVGFFLSLCDWIGNKQYKRITKGQMREPKGHHPDANLHGGHHMSFAHLFGLNHCFGWGAPTHPQHHHVHEHSTDHLHDESSAAASHIHATEEPVERPAAHRELAQPNHKSHASQKASWEVHVLELRPHDHQVKHHIVVPDFHGDRDRLGVRLEGREFTIRLPDDARAGDHLTVIAPV